MVSKLDYEGTKFPVSKKGYCKIEKQNNICINVFCYENKLTYPVYLSNQEFKNGIDLLLISNENKSHYVYICICDFNRFMFSKTKNKNKIFFCKYCLQCFSIEDVLIEHRENYLIINGKQSVKLKNRTISFKNYFKQLSVPFKIYADLGCILKKVGSDLLIVILMVHTQENIKYIFLVVFLTKLFVLTINSVKKLFSTEEKMLFTKLF